MDKQPSSREGQTVDVTMIEDMRQTGFLKAIFTALKQYYLWDFLKSMGLRMFTSVRV